MLRRLIFGLVLGLMVGAGLAAGLVRLGEASFALGSGAMIAYLAAALAGGVTGLIAGKPIWASGAKIEGGLKAAFGALMGAAAMFALRQWGTGLPPVNLSFLGGGGPAPVGELPAASLPLIAAVLGGLFGLDNTEGGDDDGAATRKRVAGGARIDARASAKTPAEIADDEGADVEPRRAKR